MKTRTLFLVAAFVLGALVITPDGVDWWWRPIIGFACLALGVCAVVIVGTVRDERARNEDEAEEEHQDALQVEDRTPQAERGIDATGGDLT